MLRISNFKPQFSFHRRGVEQWQLVGLITRRSQVRVLSPLPMKLQEAPARELPSFLLVVLGHPNWHRLTSMV